MIFLALLAEQNIFDFVASTNTNTHSSHTLPMRSSNSQAHNKFNQKFINPCHGINTLPFGFSQNNSSTNVQNDNSAISFKQPHELEDLIHLRGPLTEHAVMRTLQARFNENCYFVSMRLK